MRRLAFDCSADLRSVALAEGDETPLYRAEHGAKAHAERLVALLADLVGEAGWSWSSLDVIVVAVGPGSFTGIRVAVAAARALALANDRPVVPVSTLDALLTGAPVAGSEAAADVVAVIDARRGGLYRSASATDGANRTTIDLVSPTAAAAALPDDFTAVGSGAAKLIQAAGRGHAQAPVAVTADLVLRTAIDAASAGMVPLAGAEVRPLYVRAPDAIRQAA